MISTVVKKTIADALLGHFFAVAHARAHQERHARARVRCYGRYRPQDVSDRMIEAAKERRARRDAKRLEIAARATQ